MAFSLKWTSLFAFLPLLAFANPYETTLENGLKVIVKEDHRAPTAIQMLWYRIGAMDENEGKTGLAHVLEHMMFKGTENIKAGEFNQRVALAGGRDNAFTNHDYTAYFQQIPKEKLEEMMMLESDRMQSLKFSPEDFLQEVKVVKEERRMRTEDNPSARLFENLSATIWQTHPYRRPVIGWMEDLDHLTLEDAQNWHQHFYAPNNATLIVAGDVNHQEVIELAKKYYGTIKRREIKETRPPFEALQTGTKRIITRGFARQPLLIMAWKAPNVLDNEEEAENLELLSAVLGGHDGARLTKHLVREKALATDIDLSFDNLNRGKEGMLYLSATPAPNVSVEKLEAAIREELMRFQTEPITQSELNRARTQYKAAQIYKQDSLFAQAMELGLLDNAGMPLKHWEKRLKRLDKISVENVQKALHYFNDSQLNVGVLLPEKN